MGNKEEDSIYYLSRTIRPWALIVGLQPDTQYYVKVMAYNSAGEGPESERYIGKQLKRSFNCFVFYASYSIYISWDTHYLCINFFTERTYRKAPQKPPSSVAVFGVNPSTVRVTWRYVQPSLEEEPLQGYKVCHVLSNLHVR